MNPPPIGRRLLAEFLGSAFLAALVIGSGIAAQTLSPNDTGLELFENAAATAAGLFTIILTFGPVSGGHFNPVVSLADAAFGGLSWRDALACIPTTGLRAHLHPRATRRRRTRRTHGLISVMPFEVARQQLVPARVAPQSSPR